MTSDVKPHTMVGLSGARPAVFLARRWLLPAFLVAGGAQIFLAGLADNAALYGGPHAPGGLLALGIAGFLYASARRWRP